MSDAQRRLLDLLAGWSHHLERCAEAEAQAEAPHPDVTKEQYEIEWERAFDLYQEVGRWDEMSSISVAGFVVTKIVALLLGLGPMDLTSTEDLLNQVWVKKTDAPTPLRNVEDASTAEAKQCDVYMVLVTTSGCVFVKELAFFRSQGGFKDKDPWWKVWVPVVATSIEDARRKGCELPGAKPYESQAKQ